MANAGHNDTVSISIVVEDMYTSSFANENSTGLMVAWIAGIIIIIIAIIVMIYSLIMYRAVRARLKKFDAEHKLTLNASDAEQPSAIKKTKRTYGILSGVCVLIVIAVIVFVVLSFGLVVIG